VIEQTITPETPRERELSDACALIAQAIVRSVGSGDVRIGSVQDRAAAEADRVAAILARDRIDAAEDEARRAAWIELDNGLTVNLVDTVVPPTPEWLAKTPTRSVFIAADNWTDRSAHEPVRTVRRIATGHHVRAFNAGKMNEDQMKACDWYREQYEQSGLEGRIKSADFQQRIVGGPSGGVLFSERQQEAQTHLRNARMIIRRDLRKFFDLVIIDDIPVIQASKMAKSGRNPYVALRACADVISDYRGAMSDAD